MSEGKNNKQKMNKNINEHISANQIAEKHLKSY